MGDLMIWLPQTKRERIPFVTTFKKLVRLTILLKFAEYNNDYQKQSGIRRGTSVNFTLKA